MRPAETLNQTMKIIYPVLFVLTVLLLVSACAPTGPPSGNNERLTSGNPVFEGWYADPEGVIFGDEYWIFPTWSDAFEDQLHFDAFSSPDLVTWQKHARILDTSIVTWARQAMWAPSAIEHQGRYFLFFGANDVQRPGRSTYDPDNDINHRAASGWRWLTRPVDPTPTTWANR